MNQLLTIAAAIVCFIAIGSAEDDFSHGFGDLNWVSWESARDLAKMQRKPLMVIIHKTWCGACQALKAKFTQTSALAQMKKLSKHFIMTNTEDDEEPWEEEFQPDGKYIPRIIFASPDGDALDQVNEKSEYKDYKYYYVNPAQVMQSMRAVMKKYGIKDDSGGVEKDPDMTKEEAAIDDNEEYKDKTTPPPSAQDTQAQPPSAQPPASPPGEPQGKPPSEQKTEL